MSATTIPEGFKVFPKAGDFNDVIAPVYYQATADSIRFGMRVESRHCNFSGNCHGGVLMTFFDLALGCAVLHELGRLLPAATVNMAVDFIAPGARGDWLSTEIDRPVISPARGLVHGVIRGSEGVVARASASFKLPRDLDTLPLRDRAELFTTS